MDNTIAVSVRPESDLTVNEAVELIGKTIDRVEAREHSLTLYFTDGSELCVTGHTYEDCSLSVNVNGIA